MPLGKYFIKIKKIIFGTAFAIAIHLKQSASVQQDQV
jgi:hypothetical protein